MKKQGLEILCFSQIPVNILYATLPLVFLFKNNWIIVKESCDKPAAAKSLQSCPTLYDPIDGSPPGFPVPGILQAITLEWVAISFSNAWKWEVKVKLLSCVQLFTTPWTAAYQAPPFMGFSRQEYLSGVASLDSIFGEEYSGTLAWKIPWTEEPGGLQSMGSLRVGHDWATSLSLLTFMHWRRKWQPTPVFLPGESQGWGSLVGCRLWGHTESDTTELT